MKTETDNEQNIQKEIHQFSDVHRRMSIKRILVFGSFSLIGMFMVNTSYQIPESYSWQINFAASLCYWVGFIILLAAGYMTLCSFILMRSKDDLFKFDYQIRYGSYKEAEKIYRRNARFWGILSM